jgi:hypothetical protein
MRPLRRCLFVGRLGIELVEDLRAAGIADVMLASSPCSVRGREVGVRTLTLSSGVHSVSTRL